MGFLLPLAFHQTDRLSRGAGQVRAGARCTAMRPANDPDALVTGPAVVRRSIWHRHAPTRRAGRPISRRSSNVSRDERSARCQRQDRGDSGLRLRPSSDPCAEPQLPFGGPGRPRHHVGARDRRAVGDDLERQPVEQRQDPPRRGRRIRAPERARPPHPSRIVRSSSACHSRLSRRDVAWMAGRRAASAQASSQSWNAQSLSAGVYVRKKTRSASTGSARLGHQPCRQLEVLPGDLLERRRQHVVHRVEVVMDQAAGRAHRRRPRRGPSSTRGPSRRPPASAAATIASRRWIGGIRRTPRRVERYCARVQ